MFISILNDRQKISWLAELSEYFSKKKVSSIGLKLNGWIESKGGWVSEFNYLFYVLDTNKSVRYINEFIGNLGATT